MEASDIYKIPLSGKHAKRGAVALVEARDVNKVLGVRWVVTTEGYARGNIEGEPILLHRHLMGCEPGDGKVVDHINHDKLDNRRANLRITTHQGNCINRKKPAGIAQVPGVSWNGQMGKWRARIYLGRDARGLAVFENCGHWTTVEDASFALEVRRRELVRESRQLA